jgi:hypothetical protein
VIRARTTTVGEFVGNELGDGKDIDVGRTLGVGAGFPVVNLLGRLDGKLDGDCDPG